MIENKYPKAEEMRKVSEVASENIKKKLIEEILDFLFTYIRDRASAGLYTTSVCFFDHRDYLEDALNFLDDIGYSTRLIYEANKSTVVVDWENECEN